MKAYTCLLSTKRIEFWMPHVKISSKGQCHILHCKKPHLLTSHGEYISNATGQQAGLRMRVHQAHWAPEIC